MGEFTLRDAREADMAAVQAIYAHHVLTGYASFEEVAPDVAEMTARFRAFTEKGLPYIVAERTARWSATAMPAPTGRARPIASRSKTRSMSTRIAPARGSAGRCSPS